MQIPTWLSAKSAWLRFSLIAVISVCLATPAVRCRAQRAAPQGYITGVVRSSQGPKPACG